MHSTNGKCTTSAHGCKRRARVFFFFSLSYYLSEREPPPPLTAPTKDHAVSTPHFEASGGQSTRTSPRPPRSRPPCILALDRSINFAASEPPRGDPGFLATSSLQCISDSNLLQKVRSSSISHTKIFETNKHTTEYKQTNVHAALSLLIAVEIHPKRASTMASAARRGVDSSQDRRACG